MRGLVPNARALAAYIIDTYPGVQSIGGCVLIRSPTTRAGTPSTS